MMNEQEREHWLKQKNKPFHHPASLLGKDQAELQRLADQGEIDHDAIAGTRYHQAMLKRFGPNYKTRRAEQFRELNQRK